MSEVNETPTSSRGHVTTSLREAIMHAFDKVGGEDYLVMVARKNPTVFCALLARILPLQLSAGKIDDQHLHDVADDAAVVHRSTPRTSVGKSGSDAVFTDVGKVEETVGMVGFDRRRLQRH